MAAIDFPASPTVNQTFSPANGVVYTWNGTIWVANASSGAIVSDTPPGSALASQLWFNSLLGQMFIYYNDGNTTQWVPASPSLVPAFPAPGLMTLYSEQKLVAPANELRVNIPAGAKCVELWFGLQANAAVNETLTLNGLNGAAIIQTAIYGLQATYSSGAAVNAVAQSGQTAWQLSAAVNHVGCIRFQSFASSTMGGNAVYFSLDTVSVMLNRQTSLNTGSVFDPTGFRVAFVSAANFAVGSYLRAVVAV